MSEALANAVCHGNQFDQQKVVRVTAGWSDSRFYYAIGDQGRGFGSSNFDIGGWGPYVV